MFMCRTFGFGTEKLESFRKSFSGRDLRRKKEKRLVLGSRSAAPMAFNGRAGIKI
jgi:hypothetical protein